MLFWKIMVHLSTWPDNIQLCKFSDKNKNNKNFFFYFLIEKETRKNHKTKKFIVFLFLESIIINIAITWPFFRYSNCLTFSNFVWPVGLNFFDIWIYVFIEYKNNEIMGCFLMIVCHKFNKQIHFVLPQHSTILKI